MFNIYQTKKILIIILIILIVLAVVLTINFKPKQPLIIEEPIAPVVENNTPTNFCYYRSTKTPSGFLDSAWLKLEVQNNKLTGEFQHLPAESDSKVGFFLGEIYQPITSENNKAIVWWESRAEGMEVQEQLAINWNNQKATVGFGEMALRSDGKYEYQDKNNLQYIPNMPIIDCQILEERLFVEKYIRDNIATLAKNSAVLGGTWYITNIVTDPLKDEVFISYEDGHIASQAKITYSFESNPQKISIKTFDIIK